MDTTGSRIKTIREMRNYSQKQLADIAKINVVLLQQYEYGQKQPRVKQINKLAQALEVDPAFLQPTQTETPFSIYAILYDIIRAYGDISLEKKDGKILIGISEPTNIALLEKLQKAVQSNIELSPEDFKKWLINQPPLVHNGKIIEKGNNP